MTKSQRCISYVIIFRGWSACEMKCESKCSYNWNADRKKKMRAEHARWIPVCHHGQVSTWQSSDINILTCVGVCFQNRFMHRSRCLSTSHSEVARARASTRTRMNIRMVCFFTSMHACMYTMKSRQKASYRGPVFDVYKKFSMHA
jgi:hypothetical protein